MMTASPLLLILLLTPGVKEFTAPATLASSMTVLSSASATLQNNRNVINGLITNTSGQPLNRIRVELCDEVEMRIMQTFTDTSGRYSFRNLSQGTFIVKVHSDGNYQNRSARVTLFAARNNGGAHYEQLDFTLKSRDEIKGNTNPVNPGATFVQEVPENARKAYERALKQLENEKQVQQGLESLQEALNFFPNYYLALERLGLELVKRQQLESARTVLTKALTVNSSGATSLYALGVVQYQSRQWPEAAESLQRSLVLAPTSPNAVYGHFYLGLSLLKINKPTEAETHLKRTYELGGNQAPADCHMHLAQLYSNNKRYKEAADELELFLKQTPDARDAENIKNIIRQLRAKAKNGAQ